MGMRRKNVLRFTKTLTHYDEARIAATLTYFVRPNNESLVEKFFLPLAVIYIYIYILF